MAGRPSQASLNVVTSIDGGPKRPPAPDHFTPEKAAIWERVVGAMVPTWWNASNLDLLEAYCGHVFAAQDIDRRIDEEHAREEGPRLGALNTLSLLKGRETRAVTMLSTKMRLAQQSTYDKSKKGGDHSIKKPWS